MKKKVLAAALILCLAAASLFLPGNKADRFEQQVLQEAAEGVIKEGQIAYKDWEWELLEDGTVALTKYHGTAEFVEIPTLLNRKKVTAIRNTAFQYCYNQDENNMETGLSYIMIPDGVTDIGQGVFEGCGKLRQIDVAQENKAFLSEDGVLFNKSRTELLAYPAAKAQEKYQVPQSVCRISEYAFSGAKLSEVNLPQSLQEIGKGAFYNCKSLNTITLPSGLKTIGAWAFLNCGFTEMAIPAGVTDIGEGAFEAAYGLKAITVAAENAVYSSEDGVLYNKAKTELTAYPGGKTQAEYRIPSGTEIIGRSAFGSNSNLQRVLVPESVRRVKGNAFCRAFLQELIIQNPACIIEEVRNNEKWETTISYRTKIYGYEDSTAQSYAEGHGNFWGLLVGSDNAQSRFDKLFFNGRDSEHR